MADIDSITIEQDHVFHHSIRVIYRVSIVGGQSKNETNGTTDQCKWWHKTEFPDMVDLAQRGVEIEFPPVAENDVATT